MHPKLTCFLVVCLLAAASLTQAQVPTTMTIQGRLTDDTGAPVAAGNKYFDFRIYKSESTTAQIWPGFGQPDDIQTVYTDADGFWTAEIGTVVPLSPYPFYGKDTWLEIRVSIKGGIPEVLPRIPFYTSPFAFRVGTVDDAAGGTIVSDLEIQGALSLGDNTHTGQLDLYRSGSTDPVVSLDNDENLGGRVTVRDASGNDAVQMAPDNTTGGGWLQVFSEPTGTYSAMLDGNYAESLGPYLWLKGPGKSIGLYTDITGNASVNLGNDAINDYEILDEPGVAFRADDVGYTLGSGWTVFRGRTITTPSSGYVLVIATYNVQVEHTTGTGTIADFALCRSTSEISAAQESRFRLSSGIPTGFNVFPMSMTAVFWVSAAGTHSFYLAGQEVSGTVTAIDSRLTLLFVPTAYGTVDDLEAITASGDEQIRTGGMTQAEIDQEKADAETFDRTRMEEELADMRKRLDDMTERLDADRNPSTDSREK